VIVGAAGHIDHGKTALVKALTGTDGDRLKEEKARGITIDLGFSFMPTSGGAPIGFIDVPGHERFVHTMLAGASGIDYALLSVAADDGVKPQTLEHLAILDLLGVSRGVVVITKTDLVHSARIADVTRQTRTILAGTTLEHADVVPVSTITGEGLVVLRACLKAAAHSVGDRSPGTRFRLAVDRVFNLAGIGVVVTGTVLSGSVCVGDRVQISPSGLSARVRSLHAQNTPADMARAGDRCALNLGGPGVEKGAMRRGDVVLDPELHAPTERIDARLRLLPTEKKPLGQWRPVRLHHAALEVGARIVLLGDKPILPGSEADVQLVLDQPIAAAAQDRFVVRDVSAQRTLGGGLFLDLRPPARKRRTAERQEQRSALAIADPAASLAALLAAPPYAVDLAVFARDRTLSQARAEKLGTELELVILQSGASQTALSPAGWDRLSSTTLAGIRAYHVEYPDRQGVGREQLRLTAQPRLSKSTFEAAMQKLARAGELVLDGAFVRLPSHVARLTPEDETAWRVIVPLLGRDERFRPPRVRDIAVTIDLAEPDVRRVLKLAGRMGWTDEVAHDHFFLRSTVREMVAIAADLSESRERGGFSAGEFRDRLDNGRKVAIQILDFFDRHGVTLRRGDMRRINPHRRDLFGSMDAPGRTHGGETPPVGRPDFKSVWGSEPVPGGFDSHSLPPISDRAK
jgi:selenocysteine-specific elongation factor